VESSLHIGQYGEPPSPKWMPSFVKLLIFIVLFHIKRPLLGMIGHPYLYIGKIHTQKKKYNNRMNVIVETLLQERNKIKDFEDECSALHHQVSSMDRDP